MPFPGRREDFETDVAYQNWRTLETSTLSQLMDLMVQFKPEIAKSTPSDAPISPGPAGRPGSLYSVEGGRDTPNSRKGSISSRYSIAMGSQFDIPEDDEIPLGHNYTYIPSNPKKFYKRLVERCLEADLDAMATLPEDQQVSLGILSQRHLDVINECAVRWRISHNYRVTCFLDLIRYMYEREEVPFLCLPEALHMVERAIQETDLSKWMKSDVGVLVAF